MILHIYDNHSLIIINIISIMSFLEIKNPSENDSIVNDYLATVKRLQKRDLAERASDISTRRDAERALEPVFKSTKISTDPLANEVVPIKEEIKTLNRLHIQSYSTKEGNEVEKIGNEPDIVQRYYENVPQNRLDQYFGKYVQIIDKKDLLIDDKTYPGTLDCGLL